MRTSIFLTIVSTIALTVSAGHNQLKRRNTGSGGNSIEGTLAGDIAALQLDLTNLDIDFSKVVLYDAATAAINRVILQYALTLENLELTFYELGLSKFSEADFAAAGYDPVVRSQFVMVKDEECIHAKFLTAAIGPSAVTPCVYDFTAATASVDAFAETARILEGVGTSAYIGAAGFLRSPALLAAAASILPIEARHTGFFNSLQDLTSFPTAFEASLSPVQVFNLIAPFISSCGTTLDAFPVSIITYPSTLAISKTMAGEVASLTYSNAKESDWVAFLNQPGLEPPYTFVKVQDVTSTGASVLVPESLSGVVYISITSSGTEIKFTNTLAGIAIATY